MQASPRSSLRRARLLFIAAAVLLLASVPVIAQSAPTSPPSDASAGEELPSTADILEATKKAEQEEETKEALLESPAAVSERESSRSAYDALSPDASQRLLEESFSAVLAELNADPARVLSDVDIDKPIGKFGAIVSNGEGQHKLLESSVPVQDEVEGGEDQQVDLTLEREVDGYATENGLTEVRLPATMAGSIQLTPELGVSALPGRSDVSALRFGDKDLFFPETDTATDTLVAPVSSGVEVFEQLRSPDSPEEYRFDMTIPAGAMLRPDGVGGIVVLDASERAIGIIPAPSATDGQGAEVPVSIEPEDNSIVLRVPHKSLDLAYPILVDPVFEDWQGWYSGANTDVLGLWGWQQSNPGVYDYDGSYGCTASSCWGSGLYARSRGSGTGWPNGYWYPAGSWGQFVYTAPNSTAYISRAIFSPIYGNVTNCPTAQPHGYVGIYNVYSGSYNSLGIYSPVSVGNATYDTNWVGGNGTRLAVMGIGTGAAASQLKCAHDFAVLGTQIWEDDPENPTMNSVSGIPSSWVGGVSGFTITANASDPGLGIRSLTLFPAGMPKIEHNLGCNGLARARCPAARNEPFNVSAANFDEGEKTLQVTVEDALGKTGGQQFSMRVDRTPPAVTLSGQFGQALAEAGTGEQQGEGGPELTQPVFNVKVEATDGSNATPAQKRSGVKSIEVFVDGTLKESWSQTATEDSRPMTKTYPLKVINLTAGVHKLKVVTKDQAGNTPRTIEKEFEYTPATGMKDDYVMQRFPLPDGQEYSAEEGLHGPELAVNVMNGNLVFHQRDVDIEGFGTDLEVERYYNSQLPNAQNTEWGDGWTLSQTPQLKPEAEGGGAPSTASMVRTSGAVERAVSLPTANQQSQFDPKLKAVVTKQAGGYTVEDASGETDDTSVFDEAGRATEVRTGDYASIDYSYEGGKLSEIAVEDPASTDLRPDEVEEPTAVSKQIEYASSFGTLGSGDGQLKSPADMAIDAKGNIWVADKANNRLQKFNSKGEFLAKFGSAGSGNGQFASPASIAIDAKGNIWVADKGNRRVQKFNEAGEYLSQFGSLGTGNGQFTSGGPEGIAVDAKGNLWVSDTYAGRVQKFSEAGAFLKVVGSKGSSPGQLGEPTGIDVGPGGNVWVADWQNNRVSVFNEAGEFVRQFGSAGTGDGQFSHPDAIDVDTAGNVWVGDEGNKRVQEFNQSGEYVTQFGSAGTGGGQFSFSYPFGIAVSPTGRIWIADRNNNRVQRWDATAAGAAGAYVPVQDDPSIEVETSAGFVSSVQGEEAGSLTYGHTGDDLVSVAGQDGETTYQYDASGRMTHLTLPNGTTATIIYNATYGRAASVAVDPAGAEPSKTTYFEYSDEPRRTTVTPPSQPVLTYDIGADGSILKWSNAVVPPEFNDLSGSLYAGKETLIATGVHNLLVQAHSQEGIASVRIIAGDNTLVDERTCSQNPETPGIECVDLADEWVVETSSLTPGILQLEALIEDRLGAIASKKFWVNIPYTPPPGPEEELVPTFNEIKAFRAQYGLDLDLDPVKDEQEINDRIYDLIAAWGNPDTALGEVARATTARWGMPLRPVDAAEMEYREWFLAVDGPLIDEWGYTNYPSTYAGYEMDHAAGGILRIGFTQNQGERVLAFLQQVQPPAADRIAPFKSTPARARMSLEELEGSVVSASESDSQLSAAVTEIGIADSANTVEVGATDVTAAQSRLMQLFGSLNGITVSYQPAPELQSGRDQQTGRMLAGDRVWTDWVPLAPGIPMTWGTAGFGAFEKTWISPSKENIITRFLLAAGHMGKVGTFMYRKANGYKAEHLYEGMSWQQRDSIIRNNGVKIGRVGRSPYWEGGGSVDALAMRFNADGLAPHNIFGNGGNRPDIGPAGVARRGQRLCVSGAKTEETKCGNVVGIKHWHSTSVGIKHSIGVLVVDGLKTRQGDSGAPVWNPRTGAAIGILSGGGSTTSVSYVQPLKNTPTGRHTHIAGALDAALMGDIYLISGN